MPLHILFCSVLSPAAAVNIRGDEEEDGLKAQVTASCVWPGHATVVFFSVFSLVGCTRVVRQEGSWAWLTMSVCV